MWLAVLVVVLVAFATFAVGLILSRMREDKVSESAAGAPVPGPDGQRTIRSYMIPKGWESPSEAPTQSPADAPKGTPYANATLEMVHGSQKGKQWQLLKGRTRLGRNRDNHVVLDEERVSLHHAMISVRDGVYWLEDLGSTNGTFISQDERVMAPHPLVDGEEIRIGGLVLSFHGE